MVDVKQPQGHETVTNVRARCCVRCVWRGGGACSYLDGARADVLHCVSVGVVRPRPIQKCHVQPRQRALDVGREETVVSVRWNDAELEDVLQEWLFGTPLKQCCSLLLVQTLPKVQTKAQQREKEILKEER